MASLSDEVSIAALVISLVALIGTILQVVQQYLASASGYSSLDETVIGKWISTKHRKFRLDEMRFRVVYETPVFFVCPATNKRGPIRDKPIEFVEGTPQSIGKTWSLDPNAPKSSENKQGKEDIKGIHTTNSEMASWVKLLAEFHRMEADSRQWQREQNEQNGPAGLLEFGEHKLCLALQAKTQSWDTMRPGINRPYATTTITHLIEMAAMLGIYWKEFDRSDRQYRAEGNSYMLTGTHTLDLGIIFTFEICGKSRFFENRVIPADEVKDLAFGRVPTIFRDKTDYRRLAFVADEPDDIGTLHLGSRDEFAETLAAFGCNANTSNLLRDEKKEHSHLFSVAFELVGMVGRTLYIKNSLFRLLPNPTFSRWDKKYFSLRQLLGAYRQQIKNLVSDHTQVQALRDMSDSIDIVLQKKEQHDCKVKKEEEKKERIERLERLERLEKEKEEGQKPEDRGAVVYRNLLWTLHKKVDKCDEYLKSLEKTLVVVVLREHFQELLLLMNNEGRYQHRSDHEDDAAAAGGPAVSGHSGAHTGGHAGGHTDGQLHFASLMTATPEARQKLLMRIYFTLLLPHVVAKVDEAACEAADGKPQEPSRAPDATAVWCTLVFRMLCWLLLHDFNKNDVQIPKGELLGSRLPVYIV